MKGLDLFVRSRPFVVLGYVGRTGRFPRRVVVVDAEHEMASGGRDLDGILQFRAGGLHGEVCARPKARSADLGGGSPVTESGCI